MRTKVLPDIDEKALAELLEWIKKHTHWTISLDGWTDCSGNYIVAVMLNDGSTKHYLGNLELKNDIHSADVLCDGLESKLGEYIYYCKGIVTDSPNVMVDLRNKFCKNHPHLVNIRCVLHGINLIIHDFATCDVVKPWAKEISTLVSFFSKSHYWRNVIRKWGDQNGETKFLTKYLSIRWYSFVDMCTSVKRFRNGFQHCLNYQTTHPEKKIAKKY